MIRQSSLPRKAARGHVRPLRRSARALGAAGALALAAASFGCARSASTCLEEARQGLADAAYSDAIEAADAGLRASPDPKTQWGLELARLEAQARSGLGEEAIAQLEQLASRDPDRVPPTQYCATSDQLRTAGNGEAAIRVLDLGKKRHPGDPAIDRLIAEATASAAVVPDELDLLRSLGYVE